MLRVRNEEKRQKESKRKGEKERHRKRQRKNWARKRNRMRGERVRRPEEMDKLVGEKETVTRTVTVIKAGKSDSVKLRYK